MAPYNGAGTFVPLITFVDNTLATAEDQNAQDIDIASGLTNALTRDGQGAATANISMGGFKLTNLAPGTASTDAANYGQVSAATPITRAQALLTSYPTSTTYITTSGYSTVGTGAATYFKLNSAPASPVAGAQFQTADGAWWQLASSPDVRMFGADPTGVADSTTAFNNALLWGGRNDIPVTAEGTYLINGRIVITLSNTTLDGLGGTVLNFGVGNSDCIGIGDQLAQINKITVRGLTMNCASRTGGTAIRLGIVAYADLNDIVINSAYNGLDFYQINTCSAENVTIQGCRGQFGIYGHAPANLAGNASGLTLINVTVQALYSGADGFLWDGFLTTVNCFQVTLLSVRYGLWVLNTAASNAYYPQFGVFDNFNVDGASAIGVRIDAGAELYFVNSIISNTHGAAGQGNVDTNAVQINGDIGHSYTNDINFSNCRIGNCGQGALYVNGARDLAFSRCAFADGGKTTPGTYHAVTLISPAQDISFQGCKTVIWGTATNWAYGYFVDAGVLRVQIQNGSITGYATAPISWSATDGDSLVSGNILGSSILSEPRRLTPAGRAVAAATITLTATEMMGGILNLTGTPGAFVANTATAAQIVAASQQGYYLSTFQFHVLNGTNGTCTLTAGAGITMAGVLATATTMTIASANTRYFTIVITNATPGAEAVAIYG